MSTAASDYQAITTPEVEMAVIGSLILDPEIFEFVSDRVEAADFYDPRNQLIFQAFCEVYAETIKTGGLPGLDSIIQWLKDRGELENAGDLQHLSQVQLCSVATGSGSAPEQADIVAEMANRRRLIDAYQWGASAASGRLKDEVVNSADIAARVQHTTENIKEAWPIPKPVGYGQLPTFPVDEVFPPWVASMCHHVAENLQVPIDLPAMIALGCVAGASQRKIAVKATREWREPLCLWCIPCLETGNRKTATLNLMDAPLRKFSNDRSSEWAKNQRLVKEKKAALQSKLKKLMKGVADGDEASEREAEAVNEQLEALDRDNQQERLLAEDVTPEALESLLASNNERIIVKSDEGGFFKNLSRYTGMTDVALLLKAYSGAGHHRDRVGAGFSHLKSPCLSLILTPQPKILKDKVLAEERDSGLPARCLFVLPRSLVGSRVTDPPEISQSVRSHYFDNMTALCKLPWNDIDGSREDPHWLSLSAPALKCYNAFDQEVEPKKSENGEYREFRDWACKIGGTTMRIAGNLHLMEHAESSEPWRFEISAGTMAKAIKIARYLTLHAAAAFSIIDGSSKTSSADVVLRWIKRRRKRIFTARDCQRDCFSGKNKDGWTLTQEALGYLEELDYIRQAKPSPTDTKRPGPKPSPIFRVNRHLYAQTDIFAGESEGEN